LDKSKVFAAVTADAMACPVFTVRRVFTELLFDPLFETQEYQGKREQ